jgi:Pup-ligase protein
MNALTMGSETEYAISCQAGGSPGEFDDVAPDLISKVRRISPVLPDIREGISYYLSNGGRVYREIGGKVEHATPECASPEDVARYDKAGERILSRAKIEFARDRPGRQCAIFKNNVGAIAPDETTWGTHESYTCWVPIEQAVRPLLGHLVSRLFYAGAGLLAYRAGGLGFELSQRARHLVQITGSETTSSRPLFGTRVRKPSDVSHAGWVRAHLICKDSQRSGFGTYLTFGTTGLLFHLLNTGRAVGRDLAPRDPLNAVQTISHDPWLKARILLEDGRRLTALEIQWEYLAACERAVRNGHDLEWAPALLLHWQETLTAWARDPLSLADRLDTSCKLKIFDHQIRRAGLEWAHLNEGQKALAELRRSYPARLVRAVLADDPQSLSTAERSEFALAHARVHAENRERSRLLHFAARLQALELSFHELGGLYDQLEAAGQVHAVVADALAIDRAVAEPPRGGRAAYRGAFIRQHATQGWACDWQTLVHRATGQVIYLADPFTDGPTATTQGKPPRAGPHPVEPASSSDAEEPPGIFDSPHGAIDHDSFAAFLRRAIGRR